MSNQTTFVSDLDKIIHNYDDLHQFCIETLTNYAKNLENTAHFQSLLRKIDDQKQEIEQYTQVVFRLENQKDSLKKDLKKVSSKLKSG